jgi:hypothetical protein
LPQARHEWESKLGVRVADREELDANGRCGALYTRQGKHGESSGPEYRDDDSGRFLPDALEPMLSIYAQRRRVAGVQRDGFLRGMDFQLARKDMEYLACSRFVGGEAARRRTHRHSVAQKLDIGRRPRQRQTLDSGRLVEKRRLSAARVISAVSRSTSSANSQAILQYHHQHGAAHAEHPAIFRAI